MPSREGSSPRQGIRTTPTPKAKKEKLMASATKYLALGEQSKVLTAEQGKLKKEIKEIMTDPQVYEENGKHKEVTIPLGDGKNEIFVQVQVAESISTVDNIIGLIRKKLGAKAETYITTVEVLHNNALDNMYKSGLITEKDILDWTTTSESERLIVKTKESK